jgi:rare lipoprotein A
LVPDSGVVKKPVFSQIGTASMYGKKFHNRKTANGERFNMYDHTAAHPFLVFGTHVKVTNLNNSKSIIVRINDRGPFVKGRIIDLSYAAAQELDFIRQGITRVKVESIAEPHPSNKNEIVVFDNEEILGKDDSIQIKNTMASISKLAGNILRYTKQESNPTTKENSPSENNTITDKKISYSVQVVAFVNPKNAEQLQKSLINKKFKDVNIVQIVNQEKVLYKVFVGSFLTYEEANNHKEKLFNNSINGFIIRNN